MGLTSRKKPTYAERMNEHTVVAPTVQTVTIPVADQDRALEFYRDVLGFEVRQDVAFGTTAGRASRRPGGPSTSRSTHRSRDKSPDGSRESCCGPTTSSVSSSVFAPQASTSKTPSKFRGVCRRPSPILIATASCCCSPAADVPVRPRLGVADQPLPPSPTRRAATSSISSSTASARRARSPGSR